MIGDDLKIGSLISSLFPEHFVTVAHKVWTNLPFLEAFNSATHSALW